MYDFLSSMENKKEVRSHVEHIYGTNCLEKSDHLSKFLLLCSIEESYVCVCVCVCVCVWRFKTVFDSWTHAIYSFFKEFLHNNAHISVYYVVCSNHNL